MVSSMSITNKYLFSFNSQWVKTGKKCKLYLVGNKHILHLAFFALGQKPKGLCIGNASRSFFTDIVAHPTQLQGGLPIPQDHH